ncbi:hypothetical protein GLP31_19585 [Photobacterium carnosum]|uniref:hypothetical protein n=1 Tax=Photobacterium carnosum TaxID=2023717 RepID=UPI001E2B7A9B|nr:hypothetical protein [Photobacterium carnosum]MCD9554671.1 hypothetical protein [Photobacterium carnosum]
MPRKLTSNSLKIDIASVQRLLADAERYGDFIAKKTYINKLNQLNNELQSLEQEYITNACVGLFFDGDAVVGSKGILASFAGHSLESFQELVNKVFAYNENGSLGARGIIANQTSSNLMITGVAKGSFGFILNELSDQMELTETSLKITVDSVIELINDSTLDDDSKFSLAIEKIDQRILQSLKNFFITLDKGNTTLRIVGDKKEYKLGHNAISLARKRTEATVINEEEKTKDLKLIGLLPESCRFEAIDDTDLISGTVSKEAVQALQGKKLNSQIKVKMITKVVKSISRQEKVVYRISAVFK